MAVHRHSRSHSHSHSHAHGSAAALRGAALLTAAFAVLEALGGWWTGSLALLSDAGHMLTDAAALGLGALAGWVARKPPTPRHSYGLGRAEVLVALLNAATMLVIVGLLAKEAMERLAAPAEVKGMQAALIALAGLVLNFVVLRKLSPHADELNTRAARLHVLGDALGSVAALASGLVIALTGWEIADPVASLAIGLLIAVSAVRLTAESLHALMEGVPRGLSVEEIGREMAAVEGVLSVHDLHVWQISGSRAALSAHVMVESMGQWDLVLHTLQRRLHERFGIDHVTLQPESGVRPLVRH